MAARPTIGALAEIEDKLYTPTEAARILGMSTRALDYHRTAKRITATRIPPARGHRGLPRYTKAALVAFVATHCYTDAAGLR